MARRGSIAEKSPEEEARDNIRFNDELRREQSHRDKIAARVLHRNQALEAGVPKSVLPDVSQVKNMDDSTWNSHAERMGRYGFHGVDEQGRLLPAPNQRAAALPTAVTSKTPLQTFAEGTGKVARDAGFQTAAPTAATLKAVAPTSPLNAFSTTSADARAIAAQYGTGEAKTVFDKTPGTRVPFIAGADGVDQGPAIAARVSQNDPTLSPSLKKAPTNVPVTPADRSPLNQLAAVPPVPTESFGNVNLQSNAPRLNTDLTKAGPVFPVEPTSMTPAQRFGATAGQVAQAGANLLVTKPANAAIDTLARGIGTARSTLAGAGRFASENILKPVGGFLRGFNAGVTNASAAQFEKPTRANPTPITPTSPTPNIDRSENSLANFGQSEDDITKRKLAFAGF